MDQAAKKTAGIGVLIAALALSCAGLASAQVESAGRVVRVTLVETESPQPDPVVRATPGGPLVPLATPHVPRAMRATIAGEAAPRPAPRVLRVDLDSPAVAPLPGAAHGKLVARVFRTEL